MRVNLGNALDSHWNYLTAAVNALERRAFDVTGDTAEVIGDL